MTPDPTDAARAAAPPRRSAGDSSATAGAEAAWPLPPALSGQRLSLHDGALRLAAYFSAPPAGTAAASAPPLLLVHSVNAAASAAEVRPIYEAAVNTRPVMAVELPGFGSSDRPVDGYTPALMTGALLAGVAALRRLGLHTPVDLLAVSLSCEFAARAALAEPAAFRSVALVSPTGLESRRLPTYEDGRTKDKPRLRAVLEKGPWADGLFRLLTGKRSMRMFLEGAWGSKRIDETMFAYNLLSVAVPGARHAPYAFLSGVMFTRGVAHLYGQITQPVWVAHGTRGSFAKYDGLQTVQRSSAWTIDRFDGGAMAYFERPQEFMDRYRLFLASVSDRPA